MKMLEHCEWRVDPEIGLWYLPVCWGAVNAGPEGCTCDDGSTTSERLQAIEEKLDLLFLALKIQPDTIIARRAEDARS